MKKKTSIESCLVSMVQNHLDWINSLSPNELLAYAISIPVNVAYRKGNISWNEHRKVIKELQKLAVG